VTPAIDEGVEGAERIVVIAEPSKPYEVESNVGSVEGSVTPEANGIVEIPETLVTGSPSRPVDATGNAGMTDGTPVAPSGSTVGLGDSVAPTTPFWARLRLIELDSASFMVGELPLIGTKVVLRLLSPRGRSVINGGGIALVPSSIPVPAGTLGIPVLMTEPLTASVPFETSPGVDIGLIAVGSPSNAVVVFELEMPCSLVATEDTAEVTIADPNPGSMIVDGNPVLGEGKVVPVVLPIAPSMMVDGDC
jgi:hypothetical protein